MWPRFAKDQLKISTQTWSNQLPATVLYSRGQEVARIPTASQYDELGIKKNFYTKVQCWLLCFVHRTSVLGCWRALLVGCMLHEPV